MVSVLILTRNEEVNLPNCLSAVRWSDDVVVFDSVSDDRTVEIARESGARVFQRAFDDYGSQREAARTEVEYRYPWVLALDADERPDEQLVKECLSVADRNSRDVVAYRMRRKDHFMGRWIKHSTLYPSWFLRLYRPDRIRYLPRSVHEYPDVLGEIAELQGHLLHYSFNKGLEDWLLKHVRYSGLEAAEDLRSLENEAIGFSEIVSRDPIVRRKALKALSFRLPFRPFLRFCYMYFVRRGILDGRAGLTYCRLLSIYEYFIVLRMAELSRQHQQNAA